MRADGLPAGIHDHPADRATRGAPALGGRARVEVDLKPPLALEAFVPREMRVAEHDDVGVGEPTREARSTALRRAAVVNDPEADTIDLEGQPLRKVETDVVVAQNGMDGCEASEVIEQTVVGDVAGMNDDIGELEMGASKVTS
ncbi:MAG: hypothetical protein R2710_28545 [Acidimicrobiales bacterium]